MQQIESQSETIDLLLVDDREDNLTCLQAVLNQPNYRLTLARSGDEAISSAAKKEFAAILLDVQMPFKDGFETAREIRREGASKHSPIVFLTAIYGDAAYVNMGYEVGAVDYIFKPFNPNILKSKVAVFAELFIKNRRLLEIERRFQERKLADLEKKVMQRELNLQKRYKDLVDSLDHCVVWSANPKTKALFFMSPSIYKLTGHTVDEWLEQGFWSQRVSDEDFKIISQAMGDIEKIGALSLDHRVFAKDGRSLWFHSNLRAARNIETDEIEVQGLSVDITSRKEAEQTLRESEEIQRFFAEAGAYLTDSSLDYDKTLNKIAHLSVPRLASWCIVHAVEGDKNRIVAHAPENLSEDTVNSFAQEVGEIAAWVAREKKPHLVPKVDPGTGLGRLGIRSYISVPLLSRDIGLGSLTLASFDGNYQLKDLLVIEELARRAALAVENALLYRKSENAIQFRDEFLSIASHELKTPLTPLKLQLQIMGKLIEEGRVGAITPEKLVSVLTRSNRQLERLNSLIDDLLSVSRINLGKLDLVLKPTNLSKLIRDVVEQFRDQLVSSKCNLQLDIEQSIDGEWDEFRLEQVVINLLTNAIKYGAGGPITIRARADESVAQFTIEDQGIGIAADDQKRIFELFERAAPSHSYGGLGLGLYIVQNIIKQHGGIMRLQSEIGKGSKFTFEIPRKPSVNLAKKKGSKISGTWASAQLH